MRGLKIAFFMPFTPLLYCYPTIFDRVAARRKEELGMYIYYVMRGGVGGWGLILGQKHFLSLVTLAAAPHPPVVGAPPVLGH